jgi:hypothetical protein
MGRKEFEMKRNEYFEAMLENIKGYEAQKASWETARDTILEAELGDEALAKIDEKKPVSPYTRGQVRALNMWYYSNNKENAYDLSENLWPTDVQDFVDTIRNAGVKRFFITDHSTGLMEMLHGLTAAGCRMSGIRVLHEKSRWGDEDGQEKMAIRMIVKRPGDADDPAEAEETQAEETQEEEVQPEETPAEPEKKTRRRSKKNEEVEA